MVELTPIPLPREILTGLCLSFLREMGYELPVVSPPPVDPPVDPIPEPEPPPNQVLGGLTEASIQKAMVGKPIWYHQDRKGGAHTHEFTGAEFAKAATAYVGDERLNGLLLEQIRLVLTAGKGLTCNGGFQDQKQVCMTATFALAKMTPRIWGDLTDDEIEKIDTMMLGALVSSSFICSDFNPFLLAGTTQYTMDGLSHLHRDWNPNYRNGYVGNVIICSLYFGMVVAQDKLINHNHSDFVASLASKGLTNLHKTYTTPGPNRPTDAQINTCVHNDFSYHSISLSDAMGIYEHLTEATYNRNVHGGLNNGEGKVGSNGIKGGYVAKLEGLPNVGQAGMLTEFETTDASGPRSAAHYCRDGWYVNNYIHYVMIAYGAWEDNEALLNKIDVGTRDLRYKMDANLGGGYHDFRHGKGYAGPSVMSDRYGDFIHHDIADVLKEYHGH